MKKVLMLVLIIMGSRLYAAESKPAHEPSVVKNAVHKNLGATVTSFVNKNPNHNNSQIIDRFVNFVEKEAKEIKSDLLTIEEKIETVLSRDVQPAGTAHTVKTGQPAPATTDAQHEKTGVLMTLLDDVKNDIEKEFKKIEPTAVSAIEKEATTEVTNLEKNIETLKV